MSDEVRVTIVNGMRGGERVSVPVVQFDEEWVWVEVVGEPRRFSRETGFEHPPGGTWSTWRLSGTDHRRWKP
jgi:hypothetical protein